MNDEFLTDILDYQSPPDQQDRSTILDGSGANSLASHGKHSVTSEILPPEGQDDCGETLLPASYPQSSTPALRPHTTNAWDPRLILDLAVAVDDLDEILIRYGLSREEYNALTTSPPFRRELALTMRDVRENGASFASKARIQAESYLPILDDLVYSDTTPANVRLETIRSTVRWARLEPPKDSGQQEQTAQPQISIQINF